MQLFVGNNGFSFDCIPRRGNMSLYGFKSISIRASKDDLARWKDQARASGMKLGDYLRRKIDNSFVDSADRLNDQTAVRADKPATKDRQG